MVGNVLQTPPTPFKVPGQNLLGLSQPWGKAEGTWRTIWAMRWRRNHGIPEELVSQGGSRERTKKDQEHEGEMRPE